MGALPYGRLPDRFVDPGPLGTEEIFCCQCRVDGSFDGRFPFVRQQGSAICQHRFGRIWQFERLLHPFLSGFIVDAPTAERSIRLDDYGTFWWNDFPALDGLCFRCSSFADRRLAGFGSRSVLPAFPFYKVEVVPAVRK